MTRSSHQAGSLVAAFQNVGALPFALPVVAVAPVSDLTAWDRARGHLPQSVGIIFTSANGVQFFWALLTPAERALVTALPCYAVGRATEGALVALGFRSVRVALEGRSSAIADILPPSASGPFLFPRAREGRDELIQLGAERGHAFEVIPVYETVPDRARRAEINETLLRERPDIVTFLAPSAVKAANELVEPELLIDLKDLPVAVIGPVTAEAARGLGWSHVIVAEDSSVAALVAALNGGQLNDPL